MLELIEEKNKLYRPSKYLKNNCPVVFAKYKKLKNRVTHMKEAANRNYCKNLFSEANQKWQSLQCLKLGK